MSKKFEPLEAIRYFLDMQAQYFVEAADRLFEITKELQFVRLPVFQMAQAVDVLTLGLVSATPTFSITITSFIFRTYPRLPQCIKVH